MPCSRVICHHATANVFRGKDALFIFLLTRRMRRRTEDILDRWRVVTYREGRGGAIEKMTVLFRGELLKGHSLGAKNKASEWTKGLISGNRKAERRQIDKCKAQDCRETKKRRKKGHNNCHHLESIESDGHHEKAIITSISNTLY